MKRSSVSLASMCMLAAAACTPAEVATVQRDVACSDTLQASGIKPLEADALCVVDKGDASAALTGVPRANAILSVIHTVVAVTLDAAAVVVK